MKTGLSLPLRYVLDTDTDIAKPGFRQWVGDPGTFLAELRHHDVQTVELRGVEPGLSDTATLTAMRRIVAAGMGFTYHSWLPEAVGKGAFPELAAPPLPDTGAFLNALGISPVMVVHAYNIPGASYEDLMASSVHSLRALIENLKQHALPVRVALEINRYHGVSTPGVTYDGLLEIGQHFTAADLGFCWDMGHTQSSFLQQELPETPPAEFVARVIHTHIHDLSPDGDTHWALREVCPHLMAGIGRLEACGYTGIFNLELYPDRWQPEENVPDAIFRSIERLREISGINQA